MDVYKDWLGIPDGPRPPDHYELLRCVRFEDDANKVRAHYKKLNAHVRKYATGQYSVQSQDLLNEMAKAMLCLTDPERKRDYDESLGREVEAERDEFGRLPLLDVLVKQEHITREQSQEVEEYCSRTGVSERDAVVQMKLVAPNVAAQALALQLGHSYVDLEDMLPEDDVLDMVPRSTVKKHSVLPLFIDDGRLLLACIDEPNHELEEELQLRYGVPPRPVIVTPRSLQQSIARYYAPGARDESVAQAAVSAAGKASPGKAATGKKKSVAAKEQKSFRELSDDEKQQRKQYGILFMCWSVIVPMLLDQFLLWDKLWYPLLGLNRWLSPLPILVAPPVIWWVTQKYWK